MLEAITPRQEWPTLPDAVQSLALLRSMRGRDPRRAWAHAVEPVVLYGAGDLGQMAMTWCRRYGVPVQGVVDASASRWHDHPAWQGQVILHPQDVPPSWHTERRLLVCISTLSHTSLEESLRLQGWRQIQPFYDFVQAAPVSQPLNNGWAAPLPEGPYARALEFVLQAWGDDVSRAQSICSSSPGVACARSGSSRLRPSVQINAISLRNSNVAGVQASACWTQGPTMGKCWTVGSRRIRVGLSTPGSRHRPAH
jgi:hypothetical protein